MSSSLYDSFNIYDVDEETKQIVSSYMRHSQQTLLSNNSLLRIIPDLVHHITILYYYRTHSHYEWTVTEKDQLEQIKRAVPGQSFNNHFKLHNLDWFLKFYPNGTKQSKQGNVFLLLYLRSTPEISRMSATCKVWLRELDKGREHYKDFNEKNKYTGWRSGLVKTSEIVDLEGLTFQVTITIFEIYDKEENNVTNKYIGLGIDDKQTILHLRKDIVCQKQTIQRLTIERDELRDRLDIFSTNKAITLSMHPPQYDEDEKYENISNNDETFDLDVKLFEDDPCKVKFKEWLCDIVKLPQYLPLFRNRCCNDIRMIEFFEEDAIEGEIGITTSFHRKLIMKKAREFKKAQGAFSTMCLENDALKECKDKLEMTGILRMYDLRERVECKDDLVGILSGNDDVKCIESLWAKLNE